jgi:hypothetical protein
MCGKSCPADGGTPVCNAGACGVICDLSGTFALKLTIQVRWDDLTWVAGDSGTFLSWSKMQVVHAENSVTGTLIECGKDAPEFLAPFYSERHKIDYPSALFASTYLPTAAASATLSSASPGATFALTPAALLMGTTMADPINNAWPSAASGLTSNDMDGNGKPGVSAVYRNSGGIVYPRTSILGGNRADDVYLAARVAFSLSGTLTTCTQSSGSATVTHVDTRLFGCNRSGSNQDCSGSEGTFIDSNQPNYYQDGTATYTLVKIADTATCADVLTALP